MGLTNFELPKLHIDDANGDPLSGGKVYFYEAGTSTLKTTYADIDGDTVNSNPVILDSRGEADIFLSPGAYKILVTDSSDVPIFTRDDYYVDAEVVMGGVYRVRPGTGITVNNADLQLPIISSSGVLGVTQGTGIAVDNTDPQNPVIASSSVLGVTQGTGIAVDNTDPQNPVVAFNTATRIRAYASTAQSLDTNVWTKLLFDTVTTDTLGEFSSSRFTANNTGRYRVSVSVLFPAGSVGEGHIINISGAVDYRLAQRTIGYIGHDSLCASVEVDLVAGDYFEIIIMSSGATVTYPGEGFVFITITRTL